MTAVKQTFLMLSIAALGGCAAEAPPAPADESKEIAQTVEAVTLRECQSQLALCVRASRNLVALAECTADFTECGIQAAQDLADQEGSLGECRDDADDCLSDADTAAEIRACRNAYQSCADDVVTGRIDTAIDIAQDAIERAFGDAADAIRDIIGVTGEAIDTLRECRQDAVDCLGRVNSPSGAMYCQSVFNECAGDAISIAESIIEPLPGPTPTQLIEGFSDCRQDAADCLTDAITDLDIRGCNSVLATCVGDAADLAQSTIEEADEFVDDLLPPGVPTPLEILECNNQLAACLLEFNLPTVCTADALECLAVD